MAETVRVPANGAAACVATFVMPPSHSDCSVLVGLVKEYLKYMDVDGMGLSLDTTKISYLYLVFLYIQRRL